MSGEKSTIPIQTFSAGSLAERFDLVVRELVGPALVAMLTKIGGGTALLSTRAVLDEARATFDELDRSRAAVNAPSFAAAAARLAACGIALLLVDRTPKASP
jgi:hypothetical protein